LAPYSPIFFYFCVYRSNYILIKWSSLLFLLRFIYCIRFFFCYFFYSFMHKHSVSVVLCISNCWLINVYFRLKKERGERKNVHFYLFKLASFLGHLVLGQFLFLLLVCFFFLFLQKYIKIQSIKTISFTLELDKNAKEKSLSKKSLYKIALFSFYDLINWVLYNRIVWS
jgi:hypothetical protein